MFRNDLVSVIAFFGKLRSGCSELYQNRTILNEDEKLPKMPKNCLGCESGSLKEHLEMLFLLLFMLAFSEKPLKLAERLAHLFFNVQLKHSFRSSQLKR